MTWHTGQPPHRGDFLVVDGWGLRAVAAWLPELGWCVRGRWLGHDGVRCWCELPTAPREGDDATSRR